MKKKKNYATPAIRQHFIQPVTMICAGSIPDYNKAQELSWGADED